MEEKILKSTGKGFAMLFVSLLIILAGCGTIAYGGIYDMTFCIPIGIVVMISIKISQYRVTQINDNQYRQAIHFIEVVAKDLNTDKENIYILQSS